MKKRIFALVLAIALVAALTVGLVACGDPDPVNEVFLADIELEEPDYSNVTIPANFKIGMLCLHGESSTYDKNFIDAAKDAFKQMGLNDNQWKIITDVGEDNDCTEKANELIEWGANIVFADSFGHEKFLKSVAATNPNVQFCHATGVSEGTAGGYPNLHNAFASIYEGRYLAGVVAGLKLNEMIDAGTITAAQAKMGYVGAFTYDEVISGYTSFYLGAKSVCPSVTMEVRFTGSWYSQDLEKTAAEALINRGCKLISQHADSMGAPTACERAGVPNVSYNGSTIQSCRDTFLVSSRINWTPYFKHIIAKVASGEAITANWTGTIKNGAVVITGLNGDVIADGTVAKVEEVRTKLMNGTLNVFDCDNFTVGGNAVTEHMVDGQNVVVNGVFKESWVRSAPYFGLKIDGITLLNEEK